MKERSYKMKTDVYYGEWVKSKGKGRIGMKFKKERKAKEKYRHEKTPRKIGNHTNNGQ